MGEKKGKRITLLRALAKLGAGSRSDAIALVRAGEVTVNGRLVRDPLFWVDLARDDLRVHGRRLTRGTRIVVALSKPCGIVTTRRDERGRPTVYSLLPEDLGYIFPVGRLDMDSEGLLILTNDSRLCDRLITPEAGIPKTYEVLVPRAPTRQRQRLLVEGIEDRGELLAAEHVRPLEPDEDGVWMEVVLTEGKNREIRRLFAAVGLEVKRLVRVRIGDFPLGTLAPGAWRRLTPPEIEALTRRPRRR